MSPDDLYPKELTTCADEPAVPARPAPGQPRTDEDQARFVGDLRTSGADCRDTVASWADRRARYVKQFEDATKPLNRFNPFAKKVP